MLIATKPGALFRTSATGQNLTDLDVPIHVCTQGERGLLGVAVDPSFTGSTGHIVLYYTHDRGNGTCVNRVSRFTLDDENSSIENEQIVIDNIPSPSTNHNGGDLQIDAAGLLYISVGDGGSDLRSGASQDDNGNARRLDLLNGKILRIRTDGTIPPGNPYQGPESTRCNADGQVLSESTVVKAQKKSYATRSGKGKHHKHKNTNKKKHQQKKRRRNRNVSIPAAAPPAGNPGQIQPTVCQEIFATGLRNPFRIAFDPDDASGAQRFYINDVGGGAWEEIDVGAPGADYGWNIREGPCPTGTTTNCALDNRFVEPLFAYGRGEGCRTITGGAFVPDDNNWPAQFDNTYLFADLACATLFALDQNLSLTKFAIGTGAIHLAFGPDGALYYTTFEDGGQVRKIVYTP
jgi:glucose/arabinose dehydrogenase